MSLNEYFDQYEASHQNVWNRRCHALGIPLIIASLIWLGTDWTAQGAFPSNAWIMFIVGWAFQFLGHALERSLPEFMRNPVFLVIGPLYFARKLTRR